MSFERILSTELNAPCVCVCVCVCVCAVAILAQARLCFGLARVPDLPLAETGPSHLIGVDTSTSCPRGISHD